MRPTLMRRNLLAGMTVFVFFLLAAAPSHGQAVFTVSGSASTPVRTGHTELVGPVTFTVGSGTTAVGTLEVSISPMTFTNSATTGITVTGSGGLVGAAVTAAIADSGIVILSVPAGATAGASVTLSGIRISTAALSGTALNAQVSSSGNFIQAGQNVVRVVDGIVDGLIVEPTADFSFSLRSGVLVDPLGSFSLREGSVRSFSSAVGTLGQTTATQVIFQVTGIPDNVSVTFPSPVASSSGATLGTPSGAAETITNQSASNRVVYVFTDSVGSPSQVDGFVVSPALAFTGTPGTGTAFIQVTLGPIGAAQPSASFPSTAIPRFTEQLLPPIGVLPPSPKTLYFPISTATSNQRLAITNTASGGAFMTIRARQDDGMLATISGGTSSVTVNLQARQTTVLTLAQMFGSGASTASVALIEVESQNDRVVGTSLGTSSGGTYATHFLDDASLLHLIFERRTAADVPGITVHNASGTAGTVSFALQTSLGGSVASASRSIANGGLVRESMATLFNLAPGALPLSGYVVITSTLRLRASLLNNPSNIADEVPGIAALSRTRFIFPFFAFGGGYTTVLSVVNSSNTLSTRVTLTPYQTNGSILSGIAPLGRQLAPLERSDFDLGRLFAASSGPLTVGYFTLDVEPFANNPFASTPHLAGIVRITTTNVSAVGPLLTDAGREFFFSPTVESTTQFTGLAIVNEGSTATNVTVDVFGSDGVSRGTTTFSLPGGNSRVQLLRELVATSLGHDGGFVRVSSTPGALVCAGFRGTLTLGELLYLRGQTVP